MVIACRTRALQMHGEHNLSILLATRQLPSDQADKDFSGDGWISRMVQTGTCVLMTVIINKRSKGFVPG